MIKTVVQTIFVLTLVALFGATAKSSFASERISACEPLGKSFTPLVLSSPVVTQRFDLYLPFQESQFRIQASLATFATAPETENPLVPQIGEEEVAIEPTTQPIDVVPQQITQTPPPQPDGSLDIGVLFTLVNGARTQAGLPAFTQDERICSIAASRGPELYNEIMVNGNMHAGFYARNLPYWATENVIYQQTEQQALNWWMNSSVHRAAILGDYQYACGTCSGKACNMIFTNFTPKQSTLSSL